MNEFKNEFYGWTHEKKFSVVTRSYKDASFTSIEIILNICSASIIIMNELSFIL